MACENFGSISCLCQDSQDQGYLENMIFTIPFVTPGEITVSVILTMSVYFIEGASCFLVEVKCTELNYHLATLVKTLWEQFSRLKKSRQRKVNIISQKAYRVLGQVCGASFRLRPFPFY